MPDNVQAIISKSLRTRIMVAYALCAVAESQAHGSEWESALHTISTIRQLVGEINLLITPDGNIPDTTIREAGELAAELESRMQAIELTFGSSRSQH